MGVNDDHWAFLDDIEAPMWVDLTLEANTNNQDNDDIWFNTSHQFHQFSANQLKYAFSHRGESNMSFGFDLCGPSSPKLPPSVSRSRGKHYVSKKWRTDNQEFSLDKAKPVKFQSGKYPCVNLGFDDEKKLKSRAVHLKRTSISKSNLACNSNLSKNTIPNCAHPISADGDPCSVPNKAGKSNTTSTITSEGGQQQEQNFVEVGQSFGYKRGLFSVMRIYAQKSSVTVQRQTSRKVVDKERKKSGDHNSASSNSSVGSSSNPSYNARSSKHPSSDPSYNARSSKHPSIRATVKNLDGRNIGRMNHVGTSKELSANVVKTSTINVDEGTSDNKRRGQANITKSAHQEAAKAKVLHHATRSRALVPVRAVEKSSTYNTVASKPKQKLEVGRFSRVLAAGKENETGMIIASQKSIGRGLATGSMIRSEKGTNKSTLQRNERAGPFLSKGKARGQCSWQNTENVKQEVHFR